MKELARTTKFISDQSGAVTVDFVVLTAAICTLGAIIGLTVLSGTRTVGDVTGESLSSAELSPVGPL